MRLALAYLLAVAGFLAIAPGYASAAPVARGLDLSSATWAAAPLSEQLPEVTSLSPVAGPEAGGTAVSISGHHFEEATGVLFSDVPARSFTINSDSSIVAVSPGGVGAATVFVRSSAGSSIPVGETSNFNYVPPPLVTRLSSKSGPATGGSGIVITGKYIANHPSVLFGSTPGSEVVVLTHTAISVVTPAVAPAKLDVTVVTPGGTSKITAKDRFKATPTINGLSPAEGAVTGGGEVTIAGSGFALGANATAFKFATKKATDVSCPSSTVCTARTPAHATGTVDVRAVVNHIPSPVNSADRYTYGS